MNTRRQQIQSIEMDRSLLVRVVNLLEESEHIINLVILATPTGDDRNKLTEDNIERMELITALQHKLQRADYPYAEDAAILTPEQYKLLDKYLRDELIDVLNDGDTQCGCYELIYECFFTKEGGCAPNSEAEIERYDKVVTAYLDKQWKIWCEKLTLVIKTKGEESGTL